jgi:hypothetical protein
MPKFAPSVTFLDVSIEKRLDVFDLQAYVRGRDKKLVDRVRSEFSRTLYAALLVLLAAGGFAQENAAIGKPLPPWSAGTLDIHQIATGRGNAALFILPDGTSLLVDAGAAGDGIPQTDPHPDASRAYARTEGISEVAPLAETTVCDASAGS